MDADDASDWDLLRAGDPLGLERIFMRHSSAVYNFAFRRLASWQAAEDVTQATFTALWRRGRHGRLDALVLPSARPFLLGAARNECRNVRRGERRRFALVARIPDPSAVADHADDIAVRIDDERAMSEIRRALARIPDTQREAIELVVWAQCSLAEASVVLGVPVSTIKSRLFRARQALPRFLDADFLSGDEPATGPGDDRGGDRGAS